MSIAFGRWGSVRRRETRAGGGRARAGGEKKRVAFSPPPCGTMGLTAGEADPAGKAGMEDGKQEGGEMP